MRSTGGDAFGFGVEIRDEAMAQYGFGDKRYVVYRRCVASAEHSARFGAEDEALGGARSSAPSEHVADGCVSILRAGFADEIYRVIYDVIGYWNFAG